METIEMLLIESIPFRRDNIYEFEAHNNYDLSLEV